ncbi:nucleoid-associated protein YejK [Halomonas icarae]|uniref:Nucleoid-associated protein YejK n=1 Tax=Halomonas icarae TaxID=2691040 RepID=A0A7X4VZQ9_9GAMM|nr:nucleoid-associated protein YejK [Halomonas icarae]MDR5902757.1 nucleoid-associated protein YejK [Halomonas icarae]NAW13312.1 nucleoid-associated protein YejK [Halomonas icarae]
MPILNAIVHRIEKGGDAPARLLPASEPLSESEALEAMLEGLTRAYHAKNKAWGHFAERGQDDESDAASPLAMELTAYLEEQRDFVAVTRDLAGRLATLLDAHLSVSGDLMVLDTRFGDARFLTLALLHHREGFAIDDDLQPTPARQLNMTQMSLAARLDISQWQRGDSRQYLSWTRERGGKALAEGFAALLGAVEGVDAPGETRTLLKAFSDYVEQEDLPEESSREKTETLVEYASEQASRGEPITLEELSGLLDEQQPKAFYDHIRNADYGLSPEIPPDRKTLNQFKRFTGRAGGVSISFDSHLLGSSIEYDEASDRLIIKQVPKQLKEQLKGQG